MIVEPNIQVLTWIMTTVGFIGFLFAGKRKWWAWYINLACQILWATYALATGQMAFLAFAAAYFVIFAHNAYKWTKDHLNVKRILKTMNENESGTVLHNGVKIDYNHVPKEESNMVKHARHELTLMGEEPDVIDWYCRVIKEYASFGHSGGSAWATTTVLEKLLRFEPLTDLTNDPVEWQDHGGHMWQNRRDGRAFSYDDGKTYTLTDDRGPDKVLYHTLTKEQWSDIYVHVP